MKRLVHAVCVCGVLASGAAAQEDVARRDALWEEVSAEPYETLPELGGLDVGGVFSPSRLRPTFENPADTREERTKVFHPFGVVAKVVFEPAQGHGGLIGPLRQQQGEVAAHDYTGFFRTGGVGLARLSLGLSEDPYIPGMGLKLFPAGEGETVNMLAIPDFNGQESRDFFERALTNRLPVPRSSGFSGMVYSRVLRSMMWFQERYVLSGRRGSSRALPLDRVAAVDRHGEQVADPVYPYQIEFRPAEAHLPADAEEDFRTLLIEGVPVGTVIYEVVGIESDGTETRLGVVRTESEFVASAYGDERLHFFHTEDVGQYPGHQHEQQQAEGR